MNQTMVVYHKDCVDGFTAAWVADRVSHGDTILHPAQYGDEPPWHLFIKQINLFILDFSYPRDLLLKIRDMVHSIRVLDHHRTAEQNLHSLDFCEFDTNRSGAGMAWDFFHHGDKRPWLIDYVEDRDLWKWQLDDSQAVNAYIGTVEKTLDDWDNLSAEGVRLIADKGKVVIAYINQYVREVCGALMREIEFEGYKAALVNAPFKGISEILNHLTEQQYPIAIGWWQRQDGKYQYELRSPEDGPDVSELAKRYGGGGHQHASGFVLNSFIF